MDVHHHVWLLFLELGMSAVYVSPCVPYLFVAIKDQLPGLCFLPPAHPRWVPGMGHRLPGLAASSFVHLIAPFTLLLTSGRATLFVAF